MVILITGKKGAGKTHYAECFLKELEEKHFKVKWLDGDKFRKITENNDFSEKGRLRNLITAAKIASKYEYNGYIVLLSFIMPKKSFRKRMRKYFKASRMVYLPGGTLWEGTNYEIPSEKEMETKYNYEDKNIDYNVNMEDL